MIFHKVTGFRICKKKKKKKRGKVRNWNYLELSATSPHVYFHNLLWEILSVCFFISSFVGITYMLFYYIYIYIYILHFPGSSDGKESTCNAGDLGSIPGLGRSPGGGRGNPLQYSCLEIPHGQRSLEGHSPWGHIVGHNWENKHIYISGQLWVLIVAIFKPVTEDSLFSPIQIIHIGVKGQ